MCDDVIVRPNYLPCYLSHKVWRFHPTPTEITWSLQVQFRINNWNINILDFSNNQNSSQIWWKYSCEEFYIVGKSVKCDLTSNWAWVMSVAGQLLYSIQRRPWKHETSSQCWFNVGPPSTTLTQHWTSIGLTYRVYRGRTVSAIINHSDTQHDCMHNLNFNFITHFTTI